MFRETCVLAASAALGLAAQAGDLCGAWELRRTAVGTNAVEETWQQIRVPHDWAIAGPFDPDMAGGTAKLPWIGKGEYRRSFDLSRSDWDVLKAGGKAYLVFDGVMAKPRVFVNGRDVGGCDYGYASFALDVTAALRDGANDIGVTVDTTEHKSRWYPGAGIYRRVRLQVVPRGGAVPFSAQIVTESLTDAEAVLRVSYDAVGGGRTVRTERIASPHRWTVDDPYLYTIDVGGEKVRYGLRSAVFTADDGFHLNGKRLQLKGVDLHSDLGLVGMAFDPDIARRQLILMKDLGINAIRTSHNPPAPQFLDLCDEMGFVVWDECFDKWDGTSGRPSGVSLEDYVSANLRAFVRRDRNHPSVVLWSIGNEMRIRTDEFADGVTPERVRAFRDVVRSEDPTRPVAAGCDLVEYVDEGLWDDLDVTGWNYGRRYLPMRRRKPTMPLVYSESASAYSDNGFYSVPPAAFRDDYSLAARKTDSYDHTSAPWSDIPDVEFLRMATDRFVAGEFVWTGIDYLGEPCPYTGLKEMPEREQARSSYFGITDLCGIPKDRYWLYRSHWRPETTTCHILPHWNWTKGTRLPVYVYTNGDEAELFLNGKSLGRRKKADPPADYTLDFEGMDVKKHPDYRSNPYYAVCDKYRLRWHDVAWEPGELKAVCYRDGVRIGEAVVRTCGKPVAVRLTEDPAQPEGDCPLRFYQVDVVDAAGTRDPLATPRVAFRTEGPLEIVAAGNGDPRCYETFPGAKSYPLYSGKALVIVRRLGPGPAKLIVTSEGLSAATAEIGKGMRITQLCLARQMETPSVISNYIDKVAALGYDTVHFYVTGRIETPTFSLPPGERYSQEEIRGIVRHAAEKGVEVVPYVEIFGHADLFFRHPGLEAFCEELKATPRLSGGQKQTFCLSDPKVREFLRNYMRDLAALFPSRHFNVGMDEVFNGGICPACRAKDERGDYFYDAILFYHNELKKLGKRMWMWDDFFRYHPGTLERLPRDIVMCHWDYEPHVSDRGTRFGFTGRERSDELAQYEKLGFDSISCCYIQPGNAESLFAYARRHGSLGYMVTFWPEMRSRFPAGDLPLNAAVALLMDEPEKYLATSPFPDAVRRVLPSLTETETLAAASLVHKADRGLTGGLESLRGGFTSADGMSARALAVAVLEASSLRPSADGVDADPFSERAILDDMICRAKADVFADRLARLARPFADVRRTAAEVKAAKAALGPLAADIERLAARRRRQAEVWRSANCDPHEIDAKCQAALKTIRKLLEEPEASAPADEKCLALVFSQPDWYGWAIWTVSGKFGDEWRVLADGQWIPGPGDEAVYERRFTFRADEFPSELKIEDHGYGRAQLCFAAVESAAGRAVPDAVLAVTGAVEHPERLLKDDFEWADFGEPGFLDKFRFGKDVEARSSVTLRMRQ